MTNTEVSIFCEDGFELKGTLFASDEPIAAILIAPATGIKRQFYNHFARHLCEQGYTVLTFDNRGIGDSIVGSLNDGNPSLTNWGEQDMTAALAFLIKRHPNATYHLIGHSAGGQLVGLMANASKLSSMFNIASSSGSLQYAKKPFKWKSAFYLNFFIPVSNFLFGHTKSQWVGMGEPLPKEVSRQWSRWCNGTGYVKVDLDKTITDHSYDSLSIPSTWVHATDDDIANLDTVKDMIRVYENIDAKIVTINPKSYGLQDIGHMKFFGRSRSKLWRIATDWLAENTIRHHEGSSKKS